MPRYIAKFEEDLYCEWSTVVDAPVTYGMTREQFDDYYKYEYGRRAVQPFGEYEGRMERVEKYGTSMMGGFDVKTLIIGNRAGPDETEATMKEIIEFLRREVSC